MIKESQRFADSNLLEGMTSIRAVLRAMDTGIHDRRITEILYSTKKAEARQKELHYLTKVSGQYGFTVTALDDTAIDALAIGSSHGGILARCTPRTVPSLSTAPLPPDGFFILLDGIEDPYNFGYALRSVYAAGADGVILPERNWMSAAGVVARASAGASELLPMYTCAAENAVGIFRAAGYKVICADLQNSVSVYEADLQKPVFLIVGGEKRGIRASVLKQADSVVRIEYGREFHASLSAASAATILAYEVFRQNR